VLAVIAVVWGTVLLIENRPEGFRWLLLGFALIALLRVYLVAIFLYVVVLSLFPMPGTGLIRRVAVLTVGGIGLAFVATFAIAQADIDIQKYEALQYFDIDRLNSTRSSLTRGNGKMYSSGSEAEFSGDVVHDVMLLGKGIGYFLVSVDPTQVRSTRQLMAVPEALLLVYSLPSLFAGIMASIKRKGRVSVPIVMMFLCLMIVYSSASTNMGAMYRWRLQALPLLLILVFYGATVRRKGLFFWFVTQFVPQKLGWQFSEPVLRTGPNYARGRLR
jgi:hypothetical protein